MALNYFTGIFKFPHDILVLFIFFISIFIYLFVIISEYKTVSPRIAPFEMSDKAVNWGESVSAVCTIVSGDAPLEISWALNGVVITDDNPHISVTTTKRNSLISIDSASPSHAGEYTCVASNGAGSTSYSAELTVNGREYFVL